MSQLIGADPGALEELARRAQEASAQLRRAQRVLNSPIHATPWLGPYALGFRNKWDGDLTGRLSRAATFLEGASGALLAEARQQRDASHSDGGGSRPPVLSPAPPDLKLPGEEWYQKFKELLEALGLDPASIEAMLELIKGLGLDVDQLGRLGEFLTNDAFVGFIKVAGAVMDIADLVVDMVTDFNENDHLSIGDRYEHAIYESVFKFAMAEGIEAAMTALGGAAGAAFFGIGAVPGAALGKFLGHIGGEAFNAVMEMSGAEEFLADEFADRLVDLINDPTDVSNIMDVIGLGDVGDAIESIGDAIGNLPKPWPFN